MELLQLVQVKSSKLLLPLQSLLVTIPLSPTKDKELLSSFKKTPPLCTRHKCHWDDQNISAVISQKPSSGNIKRPLKYAAATNEDAIPLLSTRWQQRFKATLRSSFIFHFRLWSHSFIKPTSSNQKGLNSSSGSIFKGNSVT